MKPPRRVIGIDPGSVRTGYGVVEAHGNRLVWIASGTIQCGRGAFSGRLATIYREISAVCSEHAPNEAAIEGIFHARNAGTALKLGQARGVALLALTHAGLSIVEYEPMLVKKTVVGYGAADKDQIRAMVGMLLGNRTFGGLDETDALSIAICHLNQSPLHKPKTV